MSPITTVHALFHYETSDYKQNIYLQLAVLQLLKLRVKQNPCANYNTPLVISTCI